MEIDELIKQLSENGINAAGDFVMHKEVQYEVNNVESGGIGILILDSHTPIKTNFSNSEKKVKTKKRETNMERELMTFQKNGIVDGHITLLFLKLQKAGWIDGSEEDFKDLFKGKNMECALIWKGKFGKSTLVYLFRQLIKEGCIKLQEGFTLPNVLSGHFKDMDGYWLTGLDKGDSPAPKAVPFVKECIKLLRTAPGDIDQNDIKDLLRDMEDKYDKYDSQDMHIHKR